MKFLIKSQKCTPFLNGSFYFLQTNFYFLLQMAFTFVNFSSKFGFGLS